MCVTASAFVYSAAKVENSKQGGGKGDDGGERQGTCGWSER